MLLCHGGGAGGAERAFGEIIWGFICHSDHSEMRQPRLAWEGSHWRLAFLEVLLSFKFSKYFQVESKDPFSLPLLPVVSSPPCPGFAERGWKGRCVLAGSCSPAVAPGSCRQGRGAWLMCWDGAAGQGLTGPITSHHRIPASSLPTALPALLHLFGES